MDVGAHLGLYSCIAARMRKYVIAVEPHPLNLQLLYRNFQRNGLDRNFEIHAAALSDRQRIADLFGGQQGGSLLEGWSGIQSNYETIVFVNTLDRLLEGRFLDQRLVIKVDVEGNENSLLLGASETLDREPAPVWMVEIGSPKTSRVRPTRTISTSLRYSGPADTGQIRWRVPAKSSAEPISSAG